MAENNAPTLRELRSYSKRTSSILAAAAYAVLSLAGAILLWLPPSLNPARTEPLNFVDALFISTSAVSTTGLVTVDPGTTFSIGGQILILLLIQLGGLGYMTFMSFAFLTIRDRLTAKQSELTRAGLGLNEEYSIPRFIRVVVFAALAIEVVGAYILSILFAEAGVENPVWVGLFHSVSAFCTAGFSLFPNSLENFKDQPGILMTVALLSYLGAIGFIVVAEVYDAITKPRASISPTTRLILKVTFGLGAFGTLFLLIFEPSIAALPLDQQLNNAFFQAMTASTTVGFNTLPIGSLASPAILVVYLLMFVGASPSGTGGGIKSTTAALLVASVAAALRGRDYVLSSGARMRASRVLQATSTLILAIGVVFIGVLLLEMNGQYGFEKVFFEVLSAVGTVGLSMGLTSELEVADKYTIICLMYVGRMGILVFFNVFAASLSSELDHKPPREKDVII